MQMPKPKIGIVVPTLNSAATLDWTLCALRGQRGIEVDIVVADSGSEDGTLDICNRWGVRAIYAPPGNMYRAINAGLRPMQTEWITYLNSDDIVYPRSYERLVALGERERACLVYGDNDFIDSEGRFLFALKAPSPARLLGVFRSGLLAFAQPAAIFRKTDFEEMGGFDERYRLIADYDFFYRLLSSGKKFVRAQGPTVAAFRRHDSQLSTREAAAVSAEEGSLRKALRIKTSSLDLLDALFWRLQNTPTYLWRVAGRGEVKFIQRAIVRAWAWAGR
jgi:glycosyltransferase involved in cell wall biosynthesis